MHPLAARAPKCSNTARFAVLFALALLCLCMGTSAPRTALAEQAVAPANPPALPASFDLRAVPTEDGGTANYLTPVRAQSEDICWAYASLASLESSILRKSGTSVELSPWQLAYFTVMGAEEKEAAGLFHMDPPLYAGGTEPHLVAASLAAGKGATPVAAGTDSACNPMDESLRYRSEYRLTDAAFLSARAGSFWAGASDDQVMADTKRLIMDSGPVVAEFASSMYNGFYDFDYASYCNAAEPWNAPDHYVSIVGWDDAFPREHFSAANQPQADGAWLVKNSWGTGVQNNGYCWISYEDETLRLVAGFNGEPSRQGETIYQYDEQGWLDSVALDSQTTAYMANVFTANGAELLDRVMLCTTDRGTACTIEVYRSVDKDAADPTAGELAARQTATFDLPGYHTVSLDTPVELGPDERFSIVVKLENPTYRYVIPVEGMVLMDPELPDNTEPQHMGYDSSGAEEVSYLSPDGATWRKAAGPSWEGVAARCYKTNVCLKALTVPRETGDAGAGGNPGQGQETPPEGNGSQERPEKQHDQANASLAAVGDELRFGTKALASLACAALGLGYASSAIRRRKQR